MTVKLRIGRIYRYPRKKDPEECDLDGVPNFFHVTHTDGAKRAILESGINPIGLAAAPDGTRTPAILIRSSPHRVGSELTPWQDVFDGDAGYVLYYGDNRTPGIPADAAAGNRRIREQLHIHTAPDKETRKRAVPFLFFRGASHNGVNKGYVRFEGYGTVTRAELVTQVTREGEYFANYAFEFALLSTAAEAEQFDWEWIADRRDAGKSLEATLKAAPKAWKQWVQGGTDALERCRRKVSKLRALPAKEQLPKSGSSELKCLDRIYKYYEAGQKHRFEALAAEVAARVLGCGGAHYVPGWITPRSGDGGADFVGRLDLGTGFSRVKLVVLGQAKCENPTGSTSGRDIARTVARLRRGWIGVYVTTGYFSEPAQREIIEDEYPLLLINGERLAREVTALVHERGCGSVEKLLQQIDYGYSAAPSSRRPEDILHFEPGNPE